MRKKLLAVILAASLAAGSAAHVPVFNDNTVMAEAAKKKAKTPSVKKIRKAITDLLGENYLANMSLTKDEIKERFGLQPSWYTDVIAEIPMMTAHVDTLVIAKAKNKNTKKKIKKQLTDYRNILINDTLQYPMNLLKIQASKVYVKNDYVFFLLLGHVDSSSEETSTEEQIIEEYKAEIKKITDTINSLFKK
ncbi:MAG: DUF4358 domain-containing protein [Lachnospiraceae bacterium]|nr:DUF4358 domain-containing protein [Lachnospiraceae bacterium]